MNALPSRIDRMPASEQRLSPERAITIALNTVIHEWWIKRKKDPPLSEDSLPVRAVLQALEKAGYRIVER